MYPPAMFTGLIHAVGTVLSAAGPGSRGADPKMLRLEVDPGSWSHARRARAGDSISVAGTCLTLVRGSTARRFRFEVVRETLDRTTLGALRAGDRVNLEHAATATTLMGGHLVQGHIDGAGRVAKVRKGADWRVWIDVAGGASGVRGREIRDAIVPKGSVCVDGVSLTIAGVTRTGFWVALIPTTLQVTTLGDLRAGDAANIETDIIAKMVAAQLRRARGR